MENETIIESLRIDLFRYVYPGGAVRVTASVKVWPERVHSIDFVLPLRDFESGWDYIWRRAGENIKAAVERERKERVKP